MTIQLERPDLHADLPDGWGPPDAARPGGVCPDCLGSGLTHDDGSVSGAPGAPVPCFCTDGLECTSWTEQEWADFRRRTALAVSYWLAFYGPPPCCLRPIS